MPRRRVARQDPHQPPSQGRVRAAPRPSVVIRPRCRFARTPARAPGPSRPVREWPRSARCRRRTPSRGRRSTGGHRRRGPGSGACRGAGSGRARPVQPPRHCATTPGRAPAPARPPGCRPQPVRASRRRDASRQARTSQHFPQSRPSGGCARFGGHCCAEWCRRGRWPWTRPLSFGQCPADTAPQPPRRPVPTVKFCRSRPPERGSSLHFRPYACCPIRQGPVPHKT